MNDLTISEMLRCQQELWEKHKDTWSPMEAMFARNSLLWMMGELGEVIDIIKKIGEDDIMSNADVRAAFVEEMCDVLMYFNDTCLRYQITSDELSAAYIKKHNKNMGRDFEAERLKVLHHTAAQTEQ